MGGESDERRFTQRRPIELKVEYKRLNTFFADYTKNISKGGTFIRTDGPLEVGTEFLFALSIPEFEQPVRLRGKVMWVTPVEGSTADSPPGMGIRFQYASDAERATVEGAVETLMRRELGEQLSEKLLRRP